MLGASVSISSMVFRALILRVMLERRAESLGRFQVLIEPEIGLPSAHQAVAEQGLTLSSFSRTSTASWKRLPLEIGLRHVVIHYPRLRADLFDPLEMMQRLVESPRW